MKLVVKKTARDGTYKLETLLDVSVKEIVLLIAEENIEYKDVHSVCNHDAYFDLEGGVSISATGGKYGDASRVLDVARDLDSAVEEGLSRREYYIKYFTFGNIGEDFTASLRKRIAAV